MASGQSHPGHSISSTLEGLQSVLCYTETPDLKQPTRQCEGRIMDAQTKLNAHKQAAATRGSLQGPMQHKAAKQYTGSCQ